MPKFIRADAAFAAAKVCERKSRGFSIGCVPRPSKTTKALALTPRVTSATTITGELQPSRPASIKVKTSAARHMVPRIWPTRSSRRRGPVDSGTNATVAAKATAHSGRLSQKTERHPNDCTSAPPSTGPPARAMPATPAHTPIARARAPGSGVSVVDDCERGGEQCRCTHALKRARSDEHSCPRREGAGERPGCEQREPRDEQAPPAVSVSAVPGAQHQAGECQRVSVNYPLQRGGAPADRAGNRTQGHVDHRQVELYEEEPKKQAVARTSRGFTRRNARAGIVRRAPNRSRELGWAGWPETPTSHQRRRCSRTRQGRLF